MTTVRLTFRMAADSSRKGTLYFQIIHRNTVKTLSTRCRIFADEWDEPNSRIFIMSPVSARRTATLLGIRNRIRHEMQRLNGIISKYDCSGLPYNTADTYRQTLSSITTFRNGADISLSMLTAPFVESYESWLRSRRLCRNTTSFYMRILRSVYNKAAAEGIVPKGNPFATVYTGVDKTSRRAVSLADISRIKALNLAAHTPLAFARDMFLFSFYMRGMSFVDMAFLRKKDLNNNYVVYSRKKTGQQLTVRWERPMQAIVDAYGPSSTQYLLPVIVREDGTERSQYLNAMLRVNRNLKKIGVMAGIPIPLTMYVARHSWATAAKEKDISIGIISQAMGHDSENTTQIYLASIKTGKIDDANRDILNGI